MSGLAYEDFIASKARTVAPAGFEVAESGIPGVLFDFQGALVRWALRKGRAGIYADTGLGKTIMQLVWAALVAEHECGCVLIFAPLAVAEQTVREGERHGIPVRYVRDQRDVDFEPAAGEPRIYITNYEMREHFEPRAFCAVVLDESSILKSHTSATREAMIRSCADVPYRLACSATPSPNDYMELANQAEFLGVMTRAEMLAMFFVHDGGSTQNWRLKRHARRDFWAWMSSWAAVVRMPSDIGYSDERFRLPPLRIHEHVVTSGGMLGDQMFPRPAMTLSEQRKAQRESITDRVADCAAAVNADSAEPWLVWCHLNAESSALAAAIPGALEVRGSDSIEAKRDALARFSRGEIRVLVTKPSIAGFGMNWQHCARMSFVGLSHSFESFYQATRRCWRFGQEREVHAHLYTAETEGQVLESIRRKERQHEELSAEMMEEMGAMVRHEIAGATAVASAPYRRETRTGPGWEMHLGDCVDIVREMPDDSIDYTIFSPPFASLYTYSASERDMGNCTGMDEFAQQFLYLVRDLYRITRPGRLCSVHCMNLPTSKVRDGVIGIRDFRGEIVRWFCEAGWIFHSEVCIWKDPVTAMQRTKALGLLHKQLRKDSAMSRQGIPDYVVTFRMPGENAEPISHENEDYPVERWQRIASPIWTDINASRTLQYRDAREHDDERHIAPLQLDVIERCIELWSREGDLVLSPFGGIGSEGYVAIQANRRFVGCELKASYWEAACRNLEHARQDQGDMFA